MSFRLFFVGTLLAEILLCVAACSPSHVVLEGRIKSYLKVATDFDSAKEFLTPLMQEAVTKYGSSAGTAAMPGATPKLQQLGQEALDKVGSGNIEIQGRGKWAQATIFVPTEYGNEPVPTIWLKIGTTWYLYSGSGGEVHEYGEPPYFT